MKYPLAVLIFSLALPVLSTAAANVPEIPNAVSPVPGAIAAGQPGVADIAKLRDAGVRHVIDLTHDDETPHFDEATAVREAGVRYSNLPVRGSMDLTDENVRAFDQLLRDSDRPVLVHCASGNRVGAMAALRAAWIEGKPVEDAIIIGKAWGLKSLETEVRKRIEAKSERRQNGT